MKRTHRLGLCAIATSYAVIAAADTTERASLGEFGVEGVRWSEHADMTPDGEWIVFATASWNLLSDDSDDAFVDVYRRNLLTGEVERVSVDSTGAQANDDSAFPSISNDGKRIAFASRAKSIETQYFFDHNIPSNGDTVGWDVFVRDMRTVPAQTRLVGFGMGTDQDQQTIQASADGQTRLPQISGDGEHIVFASKATNISTADSDPRWDIYAHAWNADPLLSTNTLVSVSSGGVKADDDCLFPSISDDGRFIVYESRATNLTPDSDANDTFDIFLHDRDTDEDGVYDEPGAIATTLLSAAGPGAAANAASRFPTISGDGQWIAFVSWADDLIPSDTNGEPDVFLMERSTGVLTRVSVHTDETEGGWPGLVLGTLRLRVPWPPGAPGDHAE